MEVIVIVVVALMVFALFGFWVFLMIAAWWGEHLDSDRSDSDSPVRTASASNRSK
jgi:hypothetical protein